MDFQYAKANVLKIDLLKIKIINLRKYLIIKHLLCEFLFWCKTLVLQRVNQIALIEDVNVK